MNEIDNERINNKKTATRYLLYLSIYPNFLIFNKITMVNNMYIKFIKIQYYFTTLSLYKFAYASNIYNPYLKDD